MAKDKTIPTASATSVPVAAPYPGFQEFPKMLYFKGDVAKNKVVGSAEEEAEAGEDWVDAPSQDQLMVSAIPHRGPEK